MPAIQELQIDPVHNKSSPKFEKLSTKFDSHNKIEFGDKI
jgi:hypothetical protein